MLRIVVLVFCLALCLIFSSRATGLRFPIPNHAKGKIALLCVGGVEISIGKKLVTRRWGWEKWDLFRWYVYWWASRWFSECFVFSQRCLSLSASVCGALGTAVGASFHSDRVAVPSLWGSYIRVSIERDSKLKKVLVWIEIFFLFLLL